MPPDDDNPLVHEVHQVREGSGAPLPVIATSY